MFHYFDANVRAWVVAGTAITSPLWNVKISQINEYLTAALTILGIVIAIVKLVEMFIHKEKNKDDE